MNIFRSIRWRLQLWYGLLFALVLTGLGVAGYQIERIAWENRSDDELQRLAFAVNIAAPHSKTPHGGVAGAAGDSAPRADESQRSSAVPARLGEALSPAEEARGFYFALWRRNGPVFFTASAGAPADLPVPTENEAGLRQRGLFREAVIRSNPGDFALVGRSVANDLADLHRFGWLLAGGGVSIFAIVTVIGWCLVGRALRPIDDITVAAEKIAAGDLARRINTRDTDSELGRLAGVLNATFARLEAAFAQQGRFTADAAHELRTPVTVMLTHVQNGLSAGGASDEHRESFEACQRAAQRMRRIIESLLQLARLDAGQEEAARIRLDLGDVAGESVEQIRPLAGPRRITIHTELGPAECFGAEELLARVATNLVANAIHHNRDGGEVRVATHRGNERAVLTVTDNGPGIPPEHLPHLFERFYRVDKARTSTSGRTGLGLAISKAIVDAHGGTIEVTSRLGGGTTFIVTLPAG